MRKAMINEVINCTYKVLFSTSYLQYMIDERLFFLAPNRRPKKYIIKLVSHWIKFSSHLKTMESPEDKIVLNVGGKVFCTSVESLNHLPETKLGRMSTCGMLPPTRELFFDRNPKVMHGILDLYRTGELHLPSNLCSTLIRKVSFV